MDFLPEAFAALRNFDQFILYKLVPRENASGKFDKLPVDYRTGKIANAHDSNIWLTADAVCNILKLWDKNYGIGFVFTENDPFWFLDIDNCLAPCGTKWSDLALQLLNAFPGAAVEISSSQTGLHVIGSVNVPQIHNCRNTDLNIEFYTSGRFVALTGFHASGNAGLDFTQSLSWLIDSYFKKSTETNFDFVWTNSPCEFWRGNSEDEELLKRAFNSKSAASVFNGKASFSDLWNANVSVLSKNYSTNDTASPYDESAADAALAQHLAFWTGNDCERMLRLMKCSSLVREKWQREDYLPRTIRSACERQKEWLQDKEPEPIAAPENSQLAPSATMVKGTTFLTISQQIDIFSGCVYVCDDHKILTPGGYLLNPERFRVMYGGYSMPMDNANERVSRNSWEVFTESQAFRSPRADTSCFKPELPPTAIINKDGQTLANIYWPVETPLKSGDPSRFLWHMDLLFKDPRDRAIILAYMAAIVQYKGIKFQWCPLIQGIEGNGKTLLTRCVAFAIGNRYSHFPKAAEIASKFNDWQYGKIFVGVEDVYFPDSQNEIIETLKPMITGERLEIEPKGGNKVTRDLCCNYILNTNHKDGLRKTRNDRRFAPFYTAQQSLDDLKRDGMTAAYFKSLYDWLRFQDGLAIVSEFLHTYEIPEEFGLICLQDRAPLTSSTEAAIEQGRGSVEQEVLEAIGEGVIGFKNGWVSSMALDRLFTKLNVVRRIPLNRRRDLMQSIGYDWHPNLKEGRVNNIVLPDGGKPRLYITYGHSHRQLINPADIARAYSDDQK